MRKYVLVRYKDEEVLPAIVEGDHYVGIGSGVILDEMGDEAVAVTDTMGFVDAEHEIERIAKLFQRDVDNLPRVIGFVKRTYFDDEPKRDWRADV